MNYIHGQETAKTWLKMPLESQLGNIGSEFERALKWKTSGQADRFQNAAGRMLELFDLTMNDRRWHGPKLKEIARAREIACAELYDSDEYKRDPESLKKYFLQFAFWDRNKR